MSYVTFLGTSTAGYNRWRFLHESLTDLDNSFKEREGRLLIFHGDPTSVLGDLINVSYWESDNNCKTNFYGKKISLFSMKCHHICWLFFH